MSDIPKILLVEDDPFLSSLLRNRLEKERFEVVIAKDGEEAINSLRAFSPALILLDLILPKKTGFEVMEEMRFDPQINRGMPIIVISNLGQPEDVAKSRKLGAAEYFVKAKISIDELTNKIRGFVKK